MSHIFLSYSRADLWTMRCVRDYLQAKRISVWIFAGGIIMRSWRRWRGRCNQATNRARRCPNE